MSRVVKSRGRDGHRVVGSSVVSTIEAMEGRRMFNAAAVAVNPGGAPGTPYVVSAIAARPPTGDGVRVQFYDSADNESGFVIERADGAGGTNFAPLATLPANPGAKNQVTYTDDTALAGHAYTYHVFAVNGDYRSNAGGPASVTLGKGGDIGSPQNPGGAPNAPYAVSAFSAAPPTGDGVRLAFYDSADNETGFVIQRADGLNGASFSTVGTLPPNATTYGQVFFTDSSALAGHSYTYRVYAANGSVYQSGFSAPATVTLGGGTDNPYQQNPGGAPNGPYALNAISIAPPAGNGVRVSFYDSADNETAFIIERADGANGTNFQRVTTLGPNGNTYGQVRYDDLTALAGHTYRYRVYALNGIYQSGIAGPVTVQLGGGTGNPYTEFGTADV